MDIYVYGWIDGWVDGRKETEQKRGDYRLT
jgi:hypothetical protein